MERPAEAILSVPAPMGEGNIHPPMGLPHHSEWEGWGAAQSDRIVCPSRALDHIIPTLCTHTHTHTRAHTRTFTTSQLTSRGVQPDCTTRITKKSSESCLDTLLGFPYCRASGIWQHQHVCCSSSNSTSIMSRDILL